MADLKSLLRSLELEPAGERSYRAPNAQGPGGVVFGGQLLAQSIIAALKDHPGKQVKTIHSIFARGGSPDADVEIDVDVMHTGRAFGSSTVTIRQGDRLCTRSLVLMSAEEDDLIRHADPMPAVGSPDDAPAGGGMDEWEVRVVGSVDIAEPEQSLPPDLDVWTRFAGAPSGDQGVAQALVAYTTDPFLIGTAMLPHQGVGQSQAHVTLSTGVISHTLTFHEPVDAGEWFLLSNHSAYAGHGRSYGRANIFQNGTLVGSYVQDNMIRTIPEGRGASHL
jgi:acyl-CoA thioesterase II